MRWRSYIGPLLLVLVSFVIGGWLGAVVGLAGVAAVLLGQDPRRLLVVSLACVVLAMVTWVIGNIDVTGISFTLVTGNPWPNQVRADGSHPAPGGRLRRADRGGARMRDPRELLWFMQVGQRPWRELHWLSLMPATHVTSLGSPTPPEAVTHVPSRYRQPTTRFIEAGAMAWLRDLDRAQTDVDWVASLEPFSLTTGQAARFARRHRRRLSVLMWHNFERHRSTSCRATATPGSPPATPTSSSASSTPAVATSSRWGWSPSGLTACCPGSTRPSSPRPRCRWRSRWSRSSPRCATTRASTGCCSRSTR